MKSGEVYPVGLTHEGLLFSVLRGRLVGAGWKSGSFKDLKRKPGKVNLALFLALALLNEEKWEFPSSSPVFCGVV
jgi:hypothetical protein